MLRSLLALTVSMAIFACPLAATGALPACHADEAPMECCDHHPGAVPAGDAVVLLLGARGSLLAAPGVLAELPTVTLAPLLSTCELLAARAPQHPPRSHDPDRLTVFRI